MIVSAWERMEGGERVFQLDWVLYYIKIISKTTWLYCCVLYFSRKPSKNVILKYCDIPWLWKAFWLSHGCTLCKNTPCCDYMGRYCDVSVNSQFCFSFTCDVCGVLNQTNKSLCVLRVWFDFQCVSVAPQCAAVAVSPVDECPSVWTEVFTQSFIVFWLMCEICGICL